MKMNRNFLFALTLIMVTLLSSCCGCHKAIKNPRTLVSNEWMLKEMNSQSDIVKDDNNSFVIAFDDVEKRISGMAECNRFFGSYTLEPVHKISFSALGATRAMCPNMSYETEFLQTIQDVDSYTIDGDVLLLQKGGDVVLIFDAVPQVKK